MKSGYKVIWSQEAIFNLQHTFDYIKSKWTEKEVSKLAREINDITALISKNPKLFQKTNRQKIRRAVVLKLNTIFYHINESEKIVVIVTFINNSQNIEQS